MKNWKENGNHENLSQADEQGLLTYTLNQRQSVRIKKEQVIELLHRDMSTPITGQDYAYHFTQANRIPNHHAWGKYKKLMTESLVI